MRAPLIKISQSLARRLHRPSHANVRSTTPLREDNKSFCVIGTFDDLHVHPRHYFCHGAAKQRALIAAIGVEFHQERIMPNMVAITNTPPSRS